MNAEHLNHGGRDRVRVARRHRRPHRRHDLPDLPRAPPARGRERDRARADRHLDAVPAHDRRPARSCSTPTSTRAARPAAAASSGCPGSAISTRAASARSWRRTTCTTSCCSRLPDNDAWSHKNGPHSQVTSIAAADRQLERLMHAAGGPDAFLESHAVIVCSDHSQAPVEERIRLGRAFAEFDVATPSPARSIERRDRDQPGAALGDGVRARPRIAAISSCSVRSDGRPRAPRASTSPVGSRGCGGRGPHADAASCGSRRTVRWRISAAAAGTSTASSRRSAPRSGTGGSHSRLPRRAGAHVVGAAVPDRRRRAAVRRAELRVRRLGRRRPRRRRQPRLAARVGLARRATVVRNRARSSRAARQSSGRCATSRRWSREHFGVGDPRWARGSDA